jgi:hypothetical protein
MQALPGFRRVVTGHDSTAQAVIALCARTPNSFPLKAVPGTVFREVWSSPSSPGGDPTEPLDYGIVTEGDVWLVLDGEDMQLQRGDIVVQHGTKHAWSNRTEQMARMAFILLGGRYADELKEVLQ